MRTKVVTVLAVFGAGALVGFALVWCLGVASLYLTGAGYSGVVPGRWDPTFGTFVGIWYGAPVGAVAAASGYMVWLRHVPPRDLMGISGYLLGATVAGALPGLLSPGVALWAVPAYFVACARFGRRRPGDAARQAAV